MKWDDARRSAIDRWYAVRDLIGRCDPDEFALVVRDAHALCLKAIQEAERHEDEFSDFCHYCPGYTQYGGCHALIGALCEAAQFRDWHTVSQLTMNMIGMLENLRLEDAAAGATAPTGGPM